MSDPIVYCEFCGEPRNVMRHQRAEFPPDAAWKWIRSRCEEEKENCKRQYLAGGVAELRASMRAPGEEKEDSDAS